MKHVSKILVLLGAMSVPAIVQAQPYNAAHQLPVAARAIPWPSYSQGGDLQKGSENKALQYLLRNRGYYKAKIDGKFGSTTALAVRNFQRAKGLKVDGVVGSQTWPILLLRLKQGDRGNAVRAWQVALRDYTQEDGLQPFLSQEVDGIFGSSTRTRTKKFQQHWGLKTDGIVAERTWQAILQPDLS